MVNSFGYYARHVWKVECLPCDPGVRRRQRPPCGMSANEDEPSMWPEPPAAFVDVPRPGATNGREFDTDFPERRSFQWPFQNLDAPLTGHLNESVARIESLKIRILSWPGADGRRRNEFFEELDSLRGAFLQLVRLSAEADKKSEHWKLATVGLDLREEPLNFEGIVGQSPPIAKILRIISRVASTNLTVLLGGETGTGKELFARIIHNNSGRERFVAVNCGAFPTGLIESELFGHVRGAFTGATHDRKGAFEEANSGTIFLDEIGELELSAQAKLLRALESGELQRVGSDHFIQTDVRVISATNRNLAAMVKDGTFREDLFYRLNACPISIPPLRERRDEVPILLEYYLAQFCQPAHKPTPRLSPTLRDFLFFRYDFPGNIRELKNLAQYIVMMNNGQPLRIEDLPDSYLAWSENAAHGGATTSPLNASKDVVEKDLLVKVAQQFKGNMTRISAEMALSRSRTYQLFRKHGLEPAQFR